MYGANRKGEIMFSPPASEHAVACSYGTDEAGEIEYLNSMLDIYVKGLVSLVSDTINVYVMVTERAMVVKDRILNREGKTVFRPDSGDPEKVICGDPDASVGSREWKGVLRLLDEGFGHTVNDKGFRVLNQKIGLIYGDGMFLKRYARVMQRMMEMGYAASNLVIGVGGILRMHTRDTLGVTLKDVYMVINGVPTNIRKDPVTDKGKRSHCGLPAVVLNADGHHETIDGCTDEQFESSLTQLVFLDGAVHNAPVLDDMRARGAEGLKKYLLTEEDLAELLS
jgi:nicotinamide phosphoribosyltransferase